MHEEVGGFNGGIIIPVSTTDVYKLVISNFVIIFRNCTHNYNSLQPGSKCSDYITQTQTSAICVVNLENVHHASPSQISWNKSHNQVCYLSKM